MYDPKHTKLQSRLERKLLTQLMSGCRQSHCSNSPNCATAMGTGLSMSDAMKVVKPQVDGILNESVQFKMCVDEAVQRKTFLGVYGLEYCRKGIEEGKGDLSKARTWLEQNARRLDE